MFKTFVSLLSGHASYKATISCDMKVHGLKKKSRRHLY